jgi:hypothetical protein
MINWDRMMGIAPVGSTLLVIEWSPMAFYIPMAIVHRIVILFAFRALQLDAEYNTFIAALIAAVVANVVAFFLKDMGVLGVLGSSVGLFGVLVMISYVDMLKSGIVWTILMALYWVVAWFILPRQNDLDIEQIAGIPQVIMQGGLQAESVSTDQYDTLKKGRLENR